MSRTYRNNGPWVNPENWITPWKATGDHHPCFFSAHPKKYIKNLSSSVHRSKEHIIKNSFCGLKPPTSGVKEWLTRRRSR